MKKLGLALFVVAVFSAATVVPMALADHINEPTHPISGFEIKLEDYAGTDVIDCNGGTADFSKIRISAVVQSEEAFAEQEPSEHFAAGWQLDRKIFHPTKPNVFTWEGTERTVWDHQNIPAWHPGDSSKFNTAYASIEPGVPAGGSYTRLVLGVYRLTAGLLGHESGNHFQLVCNFTVI